MGEDHQQNILFRGVWDRVDQQANPKIWGSKYKMTSVSLNIIRNTIFNHVTQDSVRLPLHACQLLIIPHLTRVEYFTVPPLQW